MENKFIDLLKTRRSRYELSKESTLKDEEIIRLVKESLLHTPSAFNSQSSRALILFKSDHDDLWDIITDELQKLIPENKFKSTQDKMNMFKAAYGTILFFEDQDVIKVLQERFPKYKESFEIWSNQSAGMLNLVVWTSISENGMGASLQHYNPVIDEAVAKRFNVPQSWKLIAQMPFGIAKTLDQEKTFIPIEQRVKVYGS